MTPPNQPDFSPASKADWRKQVARELKNERADEALHWPMPDGFLLDAYYIADDLTQLPLQAIQTAQKAQPGWLNVVEYTSDSQNVTLKNALANGATALLLNLPADWPSAALTRLLHGIKLSETPVFFRVAGNPARFVETLKSIAPYKLKGGLLPDSDVDIAALAEATRLTADSPLFRTVGISGHDFHSAGATATQELAFTLARLTERHDALANAGLDPAVLLAKTWLSVSVGTSYFAEIAKLRAFRVLLSRWLKSYALTDPQPFFIHCRTSLFYDAAVTPYTNLLRATTEAMAAVTGGCDALTVHSYDAALAASVNPEFSTRIARNVSLLLAQESYLDKVADPSAGSYYVETLTHKLTEAAWTLLEQVQAMGGLTEAFARGFVQTETDRAYRAKVDAVKNGNVLVGVTKYRQDDPDSDKSEPSSEDPSGLLPKRRLAQEFE